MTMISNIKKYISENRFLKISLILFGLTSFVVVSRLAIQKKKNAGVRAFKVSIAYKDKTKKLINADYIKNEVRKSLGYNVARVKLDDVNLMEIEGILENNNYVEEVEVFIDGRNVLRVRLRQKNPIVRVISGQGSYYLDSKGEQLQLSPVATVRVPIVTGNVRDYDANYRKTPGHQFNEIFKLAKKVDRDEFLEALVEQIHVEANGSFLLIPKLGKEKIMLGSAEDLDDKVYKLKQFYKEGLTREGWGKYAYLDLQDDEIVRAVRN